MSFVIPVHNGEAWIRDTLTSVLAQADGRPFEVIVVDDHSLDESRALLCGLAAQSPLRLIEAEHRGAAAAINAGIAAAQFPIICQVDQDVVLQPGWMERLVNQLEDPTVAAAQGYYARDADAAFFARAMNLDLEHRYAAVDEANTDHVCTGNTAYRAEALRRVGPFDESMGYGYDNDMSYRLRDAGYRLTLCRSACSVHKWREGLGGYFLQQYGFGYGRLDLVAKHPHRFSGDSVSPIGMMTHPLLMSLAVMGFLSALVLAFAGRPWQLLTVASTTLVVGLALERLAAAVNALSRFGDRTALAFPLLHLGRDLAWVAAVAVWSARRLVGRPSKPSHSMHPRPLLDARLGAHEPHQRNQRIRLKADPTFRDSSSHTFRRFGAVGRPRLDANELNHRNLAADRGKVLCLIPAHNEAASLKAVVEDVRACRPDFDILVVDDGSTDGTPELLDTLPVRWLRLPERTGVGSALRAGLRYAARFGYDFVVRIDGDGQHQAEDSHRLLAPLVEGTGIDVVLGSRFTQPDVERAGTVRRLAQRILAACLSELTGTRVTDPTSGFCALGPRAVRVLAEHHPTGYPEPELRLFLNRNGLKGLEVAVRGRSRLEGKTSLTPGRMIAAAARVFLAMIVVPLRGRVGVAVD